ncbi:MAG: hypothetical protein CR972_03260 [Candidatus Moraniibacteriota bacterium]|nr:MAG: hypothetical protein CR972_03260 [Candidatus Moranbacteria bacterium]
MKKKTKKISKILCASILVSFLIYTVDWQEVFLYVRGVKPFFLSLFVLFYFFGILISAYKWQVLGKIMQFHRPYYFYFKTYLLGTFFNNFFPSFVGGDAYRTVALGKGEKRMKESSATVIVDRITGFIAIICLASVLGFLHYPVLSQNVLIIIFLFIFFIIFIGCVIGVIFFKGVFVQKIISFFPRFIRRYIDTFILFHSRDIVFQSFFISVLFSLVGIAVANYMMFIAVGVDINFMDYMSVIFLTNLIASLPISIGNIGTKEFAYIFLFGFFGVSSSALIVIVVLSRVLQMMVSFVVFPMYLNEKHHMIQ